MKKGLVFVVFIFLVLFSLSAQDENDNNSKTNGKKKFRIDSTWLKFDATIRAKMEVSLEGAGVRFNVRNSRLGLSGAITRFLDYRVQVDLSNEGRFDVLDIYGAVKPIKGLTLRLGQSSVPFSPSYAITPKEMMFSNRAFISKYFYSGTRDIGVVVIYKTSTKIPVEIEAGIFNGGKINDPIWTKRPSMAARLSIGDMSHIKAGIKIYKVEQPDTSSLLYGAEFSYLIKKRFLLQAEFTQKYDYKKSYLSGYFIQGGYYFYLKNTGMFRFIMPALRYDAMGHNMFTEGIGINRLTVGLDFGFLKKPFSSTLRLNYEKYFKSKDIPEFTGKEAATDHDKITLELIISI